MFIGTSSIIILTLARLTSVTTALMRAFTTCDSAYQDVCRMYVQYICMYVCTCTRAHRETHVNVSHTHTHSLSLSHTHIYARMDITM